MSDTPKFEVIDRRKMKAEEEKEGGHPAPREPEQTAPAAPGEPSPGPRLVVNETPREHAKDATPAPPPAKQEPGATAEPELLDELPPAPTAAESHEQKEAYDASAQRLEDLIRAQNPGGGPQPPIGFEQLG